jgi:hypothetical protein
MFSKSQSKIQTQSKTFCKVCFDAGKPESVYTSHFVKASKDINSAIVCPTLLAQECRYCKKSGHTVKYCKVLEKDNKQREKQTKTVQIRQEIKTMIEKKPTAKNIYSALVDDSDDEDNVEKNVKPQPQAHAAIPGKISYASMAAKALQKEQAQEQEKRQLQEKKQEAQAQAEAEAQAEAQLQEKKTSVYTGAIPQPRQRPIGFKRHWADSDSEDSGEDEDEDEPMCEVALF